MSEKQPSSKKQIIIQYLLTKINNGELKVGDQIPPESEFIKKFGYGRQTIHNALSDLALQGIIERTPGKGSFVSSKSIQRNMQKKMSFTEDMLQNGMTPGSKLLEFNIIDSSSIPHIAKQLHIFSKEQFYFLSRLRTGNNTPIALQNSYIPAKYLKKIDLNEMTESIENYLKSIGLEITGFSTRLRAIEGDERQLLLLETPNKAILQSSSVRYFDEDHPAYFSISYYRCDSYEYSFSSFKSNE